MKNGFFKKLASGIVSGIMCLTMIPQLPASYAASVGDKLSVGNGMNQHKGNCDGYSYEVWIDTTGGSGSMTLGQGASFTAQWDASVNAGNFLARRGLDFGSQKKATDYPYIGMDYEADYRQTGSASGNSRLCVYGWFQNKGAGGNVPLVEYYIIEDWVDWCPDGNGKMVTIDGAQYKIFQMDHTGPTINGGSETFKQYFSVRQDKRTSGHITVSDHFQAWADQGWGIGNLYEVALNAEGWQSSGVADVKKLDVYTDPSQAGSGNGGNGNGGNTTPPASTVEPDADGNYFKNDFESGTGDWTGRGDASVVTDSKNYYSGSKSLYVSGRTDNWNGAAISLSSSTFVPGNAYSFSTGVLQTSGSAVEMKMTLQYKDASGTEQYDEVASVTAKSGEWTKLENTSYTIPAGASSMVLYIEAPDSLTDFYIDEAQGSKEGTKSSVTTGSGTSQAGSNNGGNNNGGNNGGNTTPASSDSLRGHFANCFKMGTSVSPHELSQGADFIKKHFNSITPENELKPDSILKQGSTDNNRCNVSLANAAQTLKFCEQNGISLRGHTFVWYSQTPEWFFKEGFNNNGAWVSKETMNKRLENFIKDTFDLLAKEYPNLDVYSYDVCNELFLNDGGGLRPAGGPSSGGSYWAQVYGENNDEFIINAFTYARKYAPANCKLYINDYNEYIPAKTNDIYNIAMKLKEKNVIDGIGMQSHLDVSYPSAQVYKTALEKFLSTGLEVQITELDITTSGDLNAQADLFKAVFQMAVDHADQIPAFTVWGTNDSVSWRRDNNPLLFSSGYQPKPAYDAVMSVDVSGVQGGNDTPPTTTSPASSGNIIWGDANGDGIVSMADAAAILQYLGNADKYKLSDSGKIAADVYENGKGITPKDALTIQQYMAGIVTKLPVGDIATTTTKATTTKATTTTAAPVVTTTAAPSLGGTDISWIDPNKPMLAISFDDGTQSPGKRIIDAIAKEGFHATFFYVGDWITDPSQVQYAYQKGMEVANHTMSHPSLDQKSANEIRQEADGCHNKLKSIINAEPSKVLRLPYLANSPTVQSTLTDYALITCAIDTQDWNGASKDQIVNTVKQAMANGSANGAIILCHETYDATAAAMEELCPYIKSQGWQLVTVSEMAAAKGKTIGGGQVYTKF